MPEFFRRKQRAFRKQKETFSKTTTVISKPLCASFKVTYKLTKCTEIHPIGESSVLLAGIDIGEGKLGEFYAKDLRKISLTDNTVGRIILDISEDFCDQLIDKLKTSFFALKLDEATDVVKGAHLIIYIRYVLKNDIKRDLLFCKATDGTATSLKVFNIINHYLEENNINWENCTRLCTYGAQSMSGRNGGL
jgi:hypothetical protein